MASRGEAGDSENDSEFSLDLNFLTAGHASTEVPPNGETTKSTEGGQEQDSIIKPVKKEELMVPWKFSKAECIELLDLEQIPSLNAIKNEESMTPWKFSGGECIDLSCSEQTPSIKKEEPLIPWKFSSGELVELLDSEQNSSVTPIKKEPEAPWRFTKGELVEVLDSEDGVSCQIQLPSSSSIHENTNEDDRGESARSKLQQLQKALAERALGKPLAEGADQLFNKLQTLDRQSPDTGAMDPNGWMNATIGSNTDPGAAFAAAKKEYEEKIQARRSNWADEIYFRKAEMAEDARLKRLELDQLAHTETAPSEAVDEESDGGLFVTQEIPISQKRPHSMIAEVEEGDDLEERIGASDKNPSVKRAKPVGKRKHANHVESELEASMLAGIENLIANCEKTKGQNQTVTEAPNYRKAHEKNSHTSKVKATERNSRRIGKKGKTKMQAPAVNDCLNEINKLLNSNLYEEANNNLGCRALPAITFKNKQKALTALVAGVPLEERGSIRGQKSQILQCTQTLGRGRVSADGAGHWKLKGMTSSLFHHQIQAVSWMHERETGTVQPLGGLQADEMGFGKTVMMIAAIVANPPGPHDSKCTLIVCAPAIISQWMKEIEVRVERGTWPQVMRYQASTTMFAFGGNCESFIANANIILTTYQEVVRSYPRYSSPKGFTTAEQYQSWWKPIWQTERGLLHRVTFFRVILDEAQAIKNHESHTSIACRALMAKHRWALSGTPIYNSIDELYPYFRFLRVDNTGNFDEFQKNFCNLENPDSLRRLHVILKQVMTRRTHKDKLFNAPIVSLPKNHQATEEIELNFVERAIYEAFKRNYINIINNHSRAGTLEKSYQHVMTMLLRLRQLTAHPFMLPGFIEGLFKLQDIQIIEETNASNFNAIEKDMLLTMRKMIQAHENPKEVTEDVSSKPLDSSSQGEEDDDECPPFVVSFRRFLRELADSSKWAEYNNRSLCHRCKDQPDDPWVTSCEHLYCYECLKSLDIEAVEKGEPKSACLECGQYIASSYSCRGIEELDLQKDITSTAIKTSKQRRKQKDQDEEIKWINLNGKLLPSSKISAVQAQVDKWLQEDRTKKIVIFGQFLPLLKILERMCQQKKWGHCKYDGKMTIPARDQAIEDFRNNPNILIMVASLKCGGVGLNLTMASRVICVDLWWNNSVEQQAFCRVFRIGQNSETFVTRFVVKDSVDEKLQEMQKVKAQKIGAVMDDPKMLGKLTLDELLRLFGPVIQEDQNPIIVV